MDEALRESEQRFRAIFNDAAIGITLADMQGHPLEVNAAFQKMVGYSRGKLRKMFFTDFTHPEDITLDLAEYEQMKKGQLDSFSLEKRYIRKDGQGIWVHITVSLVRGPKREPKFTVGVIRDITEHKRIDEELKLYSKAVEEAPDGVQIADLSGRIIYSNKAVEEIYGFSPQEYYGKDINEMNADPEFARKVIFPALRREGHWSGEIMVKHKDGKVFPIWLKTAMVKDQKGKPLAMVGIIRDITERKILEERKDEFIGIASHELKTPITSAKIFTQILQKLLRQKEEKQALGYMTRIDDQLDKLTQLINDLLDVSRIQAGKLELRPQVFSLAKLIRETARDIQAGSGSHKILIRGKVKKRVHADKNRIGQVLINLLSNAIAYSPSSRRVAVKVEPNAQMVTIHVKDYGVGIAKEHQEKIFERFYRVGDEKTQPSSGLGIGLYVANEIIKLHEGKLWVKSEKGKGATFSFSLPFGKRKRVK